MPARPEEDELDDELGDHRFLRQLLDIEGDGLRGPGDDAALVLGAAERLVTMDGLVEGRHYLGDARVERIARKLVQRNFSDLAAMGAWPKHVLASFVFGASWDRERRHALYRAVHEEVRSVGARWIGGDLAAVDGPTVMQLVAVGEVPDRALCRSDLPVRRSGGQVGDSLWVSGALGGSLASGRHLDFEARLDFARALVQDFDVHAMIDLSDGLLLDLARLLEASSSADAEIGARLRVAEIPVHEDAQGAGDPLKAALEDGEDYELLFCLAPSEARALAAASSGSETVAALRGARCIGELRARSVDDARVQLVDEDGSLRDAELGGFVHRFSRRERMEDDT